MPISGEVSQQPTVEVKTVIFVDRKRVNVPTILVLADGRGARERAEARRFYMTAKRESRKALLRKNHAKKLTKSKRNAPPNYKFKIYRDKEVKKQLSELFYDKCAYCEFRYIAGMTGDVEHYRPKGGVVVENGTSSWPGYYWLAADWENLLPSCRLCNSPNTMIDLTDGAERTTGKHNFFPLASGSRHAKRRSDLSKERPLILNPCETNPETHLEFFEKDGHKALLRGKTEAGRRTIDICGLNRAGLVMERMTVLTQIEGLMRDIQRAYQRLNRAVNPVDQKDLEAEIKEKLTTLHEFEKPNHTFAALARKEVPRFIGSLTR